MVSNWGVSMHCVDQVVVTLIIYNWPQAPGGGDLDHVQGFAKSLQQNLEDPRPKTLPYLEE